MATYSPFSKFDYSVVVFNAPATIETVETFDVPGLLTELSS